MTHSLICLFLFTLWGVPDVDAIRAELESFSRYSATPLEAGIPANVGFEEVIDILRHSSVPISNYLDQCDRFAWQELPFGLPVTLPQTPLNIYVGEGATNYLFGALRYYLALRLVQARLFDEAKIVLEDLTPENSIDPAGVLITKAVVFHHFSEREEGLAALRDFQAIAEREVVSRRHLELAKLLQFEWERQAREDETESISRQMDDVRRRLGQGRTDEETQEAEEDVLQSLDNLIERLEAQRQRSGRNPLPGQHPNAPPENGDVSPEVRGPGNVDRRDFYLGDNWGDLPPREREEALLRIEREFPAHYRDIIEQYFREMAR